MTNAKDSPLRYRGVMVSSTFTDLEGHRAVLVKALKGQGLTDVAMENDSAKADVDVIDSSLQMVRDASAYVCLIGKKYGQMPVSPGRNPGKASITELEFNEALRLERPILLFIMGDKHPVLEADIEIGTAKRKKLGAFRKRAKEMKPGSTVHRVYATFESIEDFSTKAIQAAAGLRRYLDELDQADSSNAQAPHAAAPPSGVHLPQRKTLFIGRETEIENLHGQLKEPGALAYISGVAGRGKTALALEYAHRYKGDFESVHWIPCQDRTLVQMAGELAWQIGLKLDGELDVMLRELNRHCAQRRCLLVLDNVDDDAPSRLIPGGETSVLVTTRLTNLPFLRHYRPLQLPLFTEEQCFELFRKEIGKEEVDKHATGARALFQRLGHLPIGISVAASLVREDVRYTIEGMAKNLPASAYALLQEAVAALSSAAQALLAAMAVCAPEGFRLALAAEIAELGEAASLDALQEIHSRSLAEELDRYARRYRLHALVREAAGATDALRGKHCARVQSEFNAWESAWRQCEQDMADWRVAFAWSLAQRGDENAWSSAQGLGYRGYALARRLGRLPEAYEICERMIGESTLRDDRYVLQAWYGNQALILKNWGRLEEAMKLHQKEGTICLESDYKRDLGMCYGNQAMILQNWGRLDDAMELLKKQEAVALELDNRVSLHIGYGNQALILWDWGQLREAMELLRKQEAICLELGDRDFLQLSYGNQGGLLQQMGKPEEAMELHKKEEAICLELGNRDSLQRSYGNQALILHAWGRLEDAMELHKKEEAICLELGNRDGQQRSYGNQARILRAWGRLSEAEQLHKQQEVICLELGNRSSLAYCYWNWGLLARDQRDGKTERAKLERAFALFTELKMPREIEAVRNELDRMNASGSVQSIH
jgi:tetratricopeptide (TPR) repeat protein